MSQQNNLQAARLVQVANDLLEGESGDIYFDAMQFGDTQAAETIKKTQQAMRDAAEILQKIALLEKPVALEQLHLEQMALRAALGGIMCEVPDDLGEGSDYLRWYRDTTGKVDKPENMNAWEPFENESDDSLREHIDMDKANMLEHFKNVLQVFAGLMRVLVVVEGGVASYNCDAGVDVAIFDRDNFEAGDADLRLPAHFADLAAAYDDIPVEGGGTDKPKA